MALLHSLVMRQELDDMNLELSMNLNSLLMAHFLPLSSLPYPITIPLAEDNIFIISVWNAFDVTSLASI
jgi:hypothetical protein